MSDADAAEQHLKKAFAKPMLIVSVLSELILARLPWKHICLKGQRRSYCRSKVSQV